MVLFQQVADVIVVKKSSKTKEIFFLTAFVSIDEDPLPNLNITLTFSGQNIVFNSSQLQFTFPWHLFLVLYERYGSFLTNKAIGNYATISCLLPTFICDFFCICNAKNFLIAIFFSFSFSLVLLNRLARVFYVWFIDCCQR